MQYRTLEIDLSGLDKTDVTYLLRGPTCGVAPLLDSAGVNFIALDGDTDVVGKACTGDGHTGVTNLSELPDNWSFVESQELTLELKASEMAKEGGSEERFVYGEVLIPDHTDSQGDTIGAPLVRKTAHDYMAKYQTIGLQHRKNVSDKVSILESYIAPADFELSGNVIKKGTWLMGVRVHDDTLWSNIKKGVITGFSIGGWGRREAI